MRRLLPRAAFAAFVAAVLGRAVGACAAGNGDVIPPGVQEGPPVEAGIGPDPDGGAKDAPSDDATPGDGGDAGDGGAPVVVINEVYVDVAAGGGSQSEYIELRALPGTPLGDLKIRLIAANGTVREFSVAGATDVMPSSGLWVVGGVSLPGAQIANQIITNPQGWGLDLRAAVQLVFGAQKNLVDVVGWSDAPDAATITPPATPPVATSEGTRVILPTGAGKSIGRRPTGADTNDNLADFCRMNTTARAANSATCDP
jgi:hypothetical protein